MTSDLQEIHDDSDSDEFNSFSEELWNMVELGRRTNPSGVLFDHWMGYGPRQFWRDKLTKISLSEKVVIPQDDVILAKISIYNKH